MNGGKDEIRISKPVGVNTSPNSENMKGGFSDHANVAVDWTIQSIWTVAAKKRGWYVLENIQILWVGVGSAWHRNPFWLRKLGMMNSWVILYLWCVMTEDIVIFGRRRSISAKSLFSCSILARFNYILERSSSKIVYNYLSFWGEDPSRRGMHP